MIRAVVFDWGAVLMRTVDYRPRLAWERRLGLAPGDLADRFFRSSGWEKAQVGQETVDSIWADVGQQLGLDEQETAILCQDFWAGDRLDEDLVDLIRDLRAGGLCTALLSNFSIDLPAQLAELGLLDLFDEVVVSGQEGVMKPDPEIYQRTMARLGVLPEEAVFVDDQQGNIDAAQGLGMVGIRFRGIVHLRRALVAAGLAVEVSPPHPNPSIRAVIFDWGGVFSPLTFFKRTREWEERLNLEEGTLNRVLWGREWKLLEIGAISSEEYDTHVACSLGLADREAVQQFYQAYYADDHLDWQVVEAARALRGQYRVAMLTNAYPGHAEMVKERYGFDPRAELDLYINSAEVGLAKPDPAIYQLVLDQLEVTPGEVVLLDDMVRNTDAAQAMGIHTVVFTDADVGLGDLAMLLPSFALSERIAGE